MVQRLNLKVEELQNLSVTEARDLVVRCFFEAQKETFERAAKSLGARPSDAELHRTVEGAVRLSFRAAGADFEAPTRETLMAAVEKLAAKAQAMGTPGDIIEHHRAQLGRVFNALK